MITVFTIVLLTELYVMKITIVDSQEFSHANQCRHLKFGPEGAFDGKRLKNHAVRIAEVMVQEFCETMCYMEPKCVSINLEKQAGGNGRYKCEMNNVTHEGYEGDWVKEKSYLYHASENACVKNPCKNNATCQSGFTDKGYRCLCPAGFKGTRCETDIDECTEATHNCKPTQECKNSKGSYQCICRPGYYGEDCNTSVLSCKEAYEKNITKANAVITLLLKSKPVPIFCHMENFECGDGAWTPVMKIDGSKNTFHFNSKYWQNKKGFRLKGGKTGFDSKETKLPTYWSTSFSKICLGMKIDQRLGFIVINKTADSLYSLIADGIYRSTSLGRDTWKSLIGSSASLQHHCNMEGFNADANDIRVFDVDLSKARIGIIGNENNDCKSCDSRIGFGTGRYPQQNNTCGNAAKHRGDNGNKNTKAMGYILVQ